MDKHEHAEMLRRAIEQKPSGRRLVMDATGRSYRTVGNWISQTSPTMPSGEERAVLRRVLGPYDAPGDSVERALRASELIEWRQGRVLSEYQRQLHEQRVAGEAREA